MAFKIALSKYFMISKMLYVKVLKQQNVITLLTWVNNTQLIAIFSNKVKWFDQKIM